MPRPKNDCLRNYFSYNDNNEVVCLNDRCAGKKMSSHAGNLERHLKHMHSDLYRAYLEKKSLNRGSLDSDTIKLCSTISVSTIEKSIVELFTKNGRPLRMADDPAFKQIAKPVFDALKITLNEHNVMERIIKFSNNLKKQIKEECKGRLLSLKIDGATRQNLSVLGINIQYIKHKTVIIQTLAIKELKKSHTSEYLKAMIMEVLGEYEISLQQILTITTDNGSNMIRTVKDLNENLNENLKNENNINTGGTLELIENNFSSNTITNIRCGSHTLQLCVNDVLKHQNVKEKIDTLRHIVKKLRTQTYINILKNSDLKRPVIDCITRWNSTFDMLERLFELKDFVSSLGEDNEEFVISSESWEFICEFLEVFKIVRVATIKLQQEQWCYSDLCIIIMDTMIKLESLAPSGTKTSLLAALNKRKGSLFENDLFNAAVFLDPRIKITLHPDQLERAKKCILYLHKRITSLKANFCNTHLQLQIEDGPSTSAREITIPKTIDEYLNNLDPLTNTENSLANQKIETDILIYDRQKRLPITDNILQFWEKQGNTLTVISEFVLAIPSTQVSVERLFSSLKYILSDQRNKLSSASLEHILIVRANGNFECDLVH